MTACRACPTITPWRKFSVGALGRRDGHFVLVGEAPGIASLENTRQWTGAGGMILYNPQPDQGTFTDNHFLPAVHIEGDLGATLLAFLASHTGVTATWPDGARSNTQGDKMAAFSSRGGPAQKLGVSKPDVTAPGVQILAGHTPAPATFEGGPQGELFQAIQGTLLPHLAAAITEALRTQSASRAAADIARRHGLSKKEVYDRILALKPDA